MNNREMTEMAMLSEENVKNTPASIITELEAEVLRLYRTKSVEKIAEELNMSTQAIYGIFRRIRKRRVKLQHGVNFWNNVCKDKRFYMVLTPRIPPTED